MSEEIRDQSEAVSDDAAVNVTENKRSEFIQIGRAHV